MGGVNRPGVCVRRSAAAEPCPAAAPSRRLQRRPTRRRRKANSSLPDYAQAHRWTRLAEPFTAANGLLTANGRPRRDAIVARYQTQLRPALNEETSS